MNVHTILEIYNKDGRIVRRYKTNKFTETTKKKHIEDFILRKYPNVNYPFNIEIVDQSPQCVTLDDDYLEDYKPFTITNLNATTAQPINSSEATATLRVILPDDILYPVINQQHMTAPQEMLEIGVQQNKQTEQIDDVVRSVEPSKIVITHLSKNPKMGFVDGYNVNHRQRDQYKCDLVNVDTGEATGTLSKLQGQKGETNKYKRVLPRFKIWNDDIKNRDDHVWTLNVYLVLDVCQSGKRSLVYHPVQTFVKSDNIIQHSNPYETLITTDDWMKNMEIELELTVVVIDGAKKHSSVPPNVICHLKDINESESFNLSCNYRRSRLALVLRKDSIIQWKTLVLSNEMIFINRTIRSGITNILNVPTNTTSTSTKRRQSKKCRTKPNQRSKRAKTQIEEDHSSVENSSTNNNDSSLLGNQSPSIDTDNNQVTFSSSQTMSNISPPGSEGIVASTVIESLPENSDETGDSIRNLLQNGISFEDLTEIPNLGGNSMSPTHLPSNEFDLFADINVNNEFLTDNDPSLDSVFFYINSPNS